MIHAFVMWHFINLFRPKLKFFRNFFLLKPQFDLLQASPRVQSIMIRVVKIPPMLDTLILGLSDLKMGPWMLSKLIAISSFMIIGRELVNEEGELIYCQCLN